MAGKSGLEFRVRSFAGDDNAVVAGVTITTNPVIGAVTHLDPFTLTLTATGGTGPYVYTFVDAGDVPNGITIAGDELTGFWGDIGAFSFEIIATDSLLVASPPVAFTGTASLSAALSGCIGLWRASRYNAATGNLPSDINTANLFAQGTALLRPAIIEDDQGVAMDFGGTQYMNADADTIALQVGLNAMTVMVICEGATDSTEYIYGTTASSESGANLNTLATGAGLTRAFMYWASVFHNAATPIPLFSTTKLLSVQGVRNSGSMVVAYLNNTAYTGASTISDVALGTTTYIQLGCNGGATPTFLFNGNIRCVIQFNKALSAAEQEAAQNFLENKFSVGSFGVTFWP